MIDTTKVIKNQRQHKNILKILISSTFGENITHGVTKCKNKVYETCGIIIEKKSYTFKNPKTKFVINKDCSCISKNVVYIIAYNKF